MGPGREKCQESIVIDNRVALVEQLGLNRSQFKQDLNSDKTEAQLLKEFELRDELYVHSFPSLVLDVNNDLIF